MELQKVIADLKSQRDRIDEAIVALERLAQGGKKKRGRPPGSKTKQKPNEK